MTARRSGCEIQNIIIRSQLSTWEQAEQYCGNSIRMGKFFLVATGGQGSKEARLVLMLTSWPCIQGHVPLASNPPFRNENRIRLVQILAYKFQSRDLRKHMDPKTVTMIEDETLEFIKVNMDQLFMYYISGEEFP